MTGFEFAVTYAVCWWLVLFMVLPHQAEAPAEPGRGHARSAPANPQLKKKLRLTTLVAILPAVALYFIVAEAKAQDTIYHVGSAGGCKPLNAKPGDDLNARDGYGVGGKTVKPANLDGANPYVPESYDMPLRIPAGKYVKSSGGQDMSDSFISAGKVSVSRDGTTTLNGKPIGPSTTDCPPDAVQ